MLGYISRILSDGDASLRSRLIGVYALLIGANVFVWVWALAVLHDHPVVLGTAFLAYTFGLRHAVDADHIAAIDNVTRKLMQHGQRPVGVGLFFSLGHSAVVVALSVAVAFAASAMIGRFDSLKAVGSIIGTSVSALFLFAIAIVNVIVLVSVYRTFQAVKRGERFAGDDFDILLNSRGFLTRIFRPLFRLVIKSWHMLPIGVLVRARLRHGDRSRPVRILRYAGDRWPVCRDNLGVPRAVHRGHVACGHDRRRADAGSLWLGVYEAQP